MEDHLFCKTGFVGYKCSMPHIYLTLIKDHLFQQTILHRPLRVVFQRVLYCILYPVEVCIKQNILVENRKPKYHGNMLFYSAIVMQWLLEEPVKFCGKLDV